MPRENDRCFLCHASSLFERLKQTFGASEQFQKALQIIDGCSLITTQGYHKPLTTQFDDETRSLSYRGALFDSEEEGTPGYWLLSELYAVQSQFGDFVECVHTGQGFAEEKITGNMRHIIRAVARTRVANNCTQPDPNAYKKADTWTQNFYLH
jgi:hypothetical protein